MKGWRKRRIRGEGVEEEEDTGWRGGGRGGHGVKGWRKRRTWGEGMEEEEDMG